MAAAFTPCLPSFLHRGGAVGILFFHIVWAKRIYRFSINFLRFPRFFEKGAFVKITTFSHPLLRAFASSREINQVSPRAVRVQGVHAKAQRRKGAKKEEI
jgi:hypothetical protein